MMIALNLVPSIELYLIVRLSPEQLSLLKQNPLASGQGAINLIQVQKWSFAREKTPDPELDLVERDL